MKISKGFWVLVGIQIILLVIIISLLYKQNIQNGYVAIPGPQGNQGPSGPIGGSHIPIKGIDYFDGKNGLQGEKGGIGRTGPQGAIGKTGPIGVQGPQGPQGVQGIQGEQGPPGPAQETRCVELEDGRIRHDKRYQGEPSWQVDYYLPVGSSCDG